MRGHFYAVIEVDNTDYAVGERIVVLEKGEIIKDIATSSATLKELEAYFAGSETF